MIRTIRVLLASLACLSTVGCGIGPTIFTVGNNAITVSDVIPKGKMLKRITTTSTTQEE